VRKIIIIIYFIYYKNKMSTKTTKNTVSRKTSVKENLKENLKEPVKPQVVTPPVTKEVVVETPVTPVVETPVAPVETTTPVSDMENAEVSLKQRIESLIKTRMAALTEIKAEIMELKKLQKDMETLVKNANKKQKKRRVMNNNGVKRSPSGFASPVVVSDDLYKFLERYGVKSGTPIARTDVTRHITTYISENNLQNPEFRREIVPDATLKGLFGEPIELKDKTDPNSQKVYTYLQLQRYLSPHFPKKVTATA
jgi:upstream activation factor subunit UAF30